VHLWVEGFFEVFATAVVALIFTRLGLIRAVTANRAIVAETIVFLFGGILGTLHHLYWTGTPTSVIAVGAVFSALEVVPLALIGIEGWQSYKRSRAAPWVAAYRWPILCFVAVGFWNTVGAGLLGFAINPPASLYYVQGLNMTPAHGHAALFGVYGMLGIGLMLFCLRGLYARSLHADRYLAWTFWGLNVGLAMMVFVSLLPAGIYQAWASISQGLWFARSPEIVHSRVMETLVWLRVPGDVVFAAGGVLLAVYALKLLRRPRIGEARPAAGVLQRHIALEEDVLFPAFEKHSGMYHAGPTRVMRIEHGQLRSLLDVLASATRDRDVRRYLRIADVLSALDREHSTREDRIVYAMIDAALGARAVELIACGALARAV
jgi:nitric oxide reductase subunit B